MASVLGVLKSPSQTASCIRRVRDAGFDDIDAYSPVPSHEIEEASARGPSGVRAWTLIGGLTGVSLGYLMTIWMAYDWDMVIGGKPWASIPSDTIIAFELTILFGGGLTVVGMLIHALWFGRAKRQAYRPSFSGDEFGCIVGCQTDQIARVQELLNEAGCTEVRVVEG